MLYYVILFHVVLYHVHIYIYTYYRMVPPSDVNVGL